MNFADHPKSIAEVKAGRERDSSLWSPRDALISLLRDMDEGVVAPEFLICAHTYRDSDGDLCVGFVNATPDGVTALGLLTAAQFRFADQS